MNELLKRGVGVRNRSRGWTPLFEATLKGYADVARLLIKYGSDVDALCHGLTPLFIAVQSGRVELGELLLANGAKPDRFCGIKNGNGPSISFGTALQFAVCRHSGELSTLLRRGLDPNATGRDWLTQLNLIEEVGLKSLEPMEIGELQAGATGKHDDLEAIVSLLLKWGANVVSWI